MLLPDPATFWATTGSFPHEVIIKWPTFISVKSVTVNLLGGVPCLSRCLEKQYLNAACTAHHQKYLPLPDHALAMQLILKGAIMLNS
jgi:hypothetical protein